MESTLRAGAGHAGLTLIETLGWDGARLVRLPLHLARLEQSAQFLGWSCNLALAEAELRKAVPEASARMRLTLDAMGRIHVEAAPMPMRAVHWRVGVAGQRLQSGDAWLRVKSSRRAGYDAARAAMPACVDEVILLNERDEVCDGSITTVFFDRGQGLRTPPLVCGVLPGVLRAELSVREEVLHAKDLPNVRLWVGNSLRGLMQATLTSI